MIEWFPFFFPPSSQTISRSSLVKLIEHGTADNFQLQFSELRLELALVHKRISPLFSRNSRKFYFAHVPKCGKFAYEFHRVLWENLSRGSYRESIEAKSSLNLRICNFVRSSNGRRWKNSYQLWRWGMIEGTNERDDNIYLSPRKKINIFTWTCTNFVSSGNNGQLVFPRWKGEEFVKKGFVSAKKRP